MATFQNPSLRRYGLQYLKRIKARAMETTRSKRNDGSDMGWSVKHICTPLYHHPQDLPFSLWLKYLAHGEECLPSSQRVFKGIIGEMICDRHLSKIVHLF